MLLSDCVCCIVGWQFNQHELIFEAYWYVLFSHCKHNIFIAISLICISRPYFNISYISILIFFLLYSWHKYKFLTNFYQFIYWTSLSLLPGLLWPGVVVLIVIPSMGQIDLFKHYLYLIGLCAKNNYTKTIKI